jgi:serine/threonine-protein kinase RsbT
MTLLKNEKFPIVADEDIARARLAARQWAVECGFSIVNQTKFVTAVSELARNTLVYGKGGFMSLATVENNLRKGVRAVFEDRGPGISDIPRALENGFTTGGGLGLGLGGARRLCNEFEIVSNPGEGTRVTIVRWV